MRIIAILFIYLIGCGSNSGTSPTGKWCTTNEVIELNNDNTFNETKGDLSITGHWISDETTMTFHTDEGSQNTINYWLVDGDLYLGELMFVRCNN